MVVATSTLNCHSQHAAANSFQHIVQVIPTTFRIIFLAEIYPRPCAQKPRGNACLVVGFVQFVTGNLFNNKLIDESGSIKLTLWADDTEKVKDGDMVSIEGGYTTTFRDEIQLNKGRKDGKLEVTSG